MPVELPVLTIADSAAWSSWLFRSGGTSKGVWLTLAKKSATTPTSLTYAQALDEALCHGWIDGQIRKGDGKTAATSYAQRFTPPRLEREGRITEAGRRVVEAAKAGGRWEAAYAGQATAELPEEFLVAVAAVPAAQATFDRLSRQNCFLMYYRLKSLKTQAGRERRIAAFVDILARGEVPYSRRQSVQSPSLETSSTRKEKKPSVSTYLSQAIRRSERVSQRAGRSSQE
ncbi:hypothetical protein Daesc_009831 [Daldinia eschscholtzii]|uniref:Bacteriocin-protection protein n=1 Tax=Daldinia eschscholtzii TaxID=292717 RepID=A0AAX6M6U1_9PEZI